MSAGRGLLDTSVFIAAESGRPLEVGQLPEESAICPVTVAELHVGVLAASDSEIRARRLRTLEAAAEIEVLPMDQAVGAAWARLRIHLAEHKRRLNVNDLWVAATAVAYGLPVVTQDADFGPVEGAAGLKIIRA